MRIEGIFDGLNVLYGEAERFWRREEDYAYRFFRVRSRIPVIRRKRPTAMPRMFGQMRMMNPAMIERIAVRSASFLGICV